MKFVFKWILPVVLALMVLIEGVHYSFELMNCPLDMEMFAGVLLFVFTFGAFLSFGVWFIKRVSRALSL